MLSRFLCFLHRFSHISPVEWKLLPRSCKKNVLCLVVQSCPTLCNPMDCSPSGSSVRGDSPGKNTGEGPPPGDLPNTEMEPRSPASQVGSLPAELPGKPCKKNRATKISLGTPGGPGAETSSSQGRGPGFHPWLGKEIPHVTTKTQHSQIDTENNNSRPG